FLRFEVPNDGLYRKPDGTAFAAGDSIQITVTVVDTKQFRFDFQPSGLQFNPNDPARLKVEYHYADPDFNGDGSVDSGDAEIEGLPPEVIASRTPFALLAAEAHGRLGAHHEAGRWAAAALAVARGRGERHAELRARNYQGAIALQGGEVDGAEAHFAAALDLARTLDDPAAEARCFNNLGIIANLRGEWREALASYQLALAAYQQAGLARGMAETQHNI